MKYRLTKLKNKLRVLTVSMPTLASATVTIWVRTGSRFEEKKINGISHFLEHMVFKGSSKYPTAKDIFEIIDSLGAENNAATSKEWTNFYIKARAGVLDTAFDVLSDVVLNPRLEASEIEKEQGVILEEMAMHEDTPISKIGDVFENLIFTNTLLGQDVIGTRENIRLIKRNDFVNYRNKHYYPQNMLVTVAGGVKEKDVLGLANKYFSEFSRPEKKIKPTGTYKQTKPKALLRSKKTDQAHLIIGFRGNEYGHKDRYIEGLLSAILGGGASSRLFIEVRERRGLAYAVKTSTGHYIDTGYLATYAGVRVKKADEVVKVILEECEKIKRRGNLDKSELKKAKEYIKGHLALSLEDTEAVNGFFGWEQIILGKVRTPEEVFAEIDKVTVDDIVRVAKGMFKPEKLNLAIIGPYKSQARFERLLT